jgi:beta-lactamase superfamily II metal-dependent hydrolase
MNDIFEVTFLSHETADSFLLRIGDAKRQTHILVDGGLAKGTKTLVPHIRALNEAGKSLDLVVVTHVDNDHISGILSLFRNDFINKDFVKEVWFNGKASASPTSDSAALKVGFDQGNKLSKLLRDKGIAFRGVIGNGNTIYADDMCKVSVLAPSKQALERVNSDWDSHDSLKVGSEIPDHDVPWAEFDDEDFIEDNSSTNRSSVVLYIEAVLSGKTAIFSGDSVPTEILNHVPLRQNLDLLKIPHHGSKSNTNKVLIQRLPAKRYIITAGSGSKKPHKKTLHTLFSNTEEKFDLYVPKGNWSVQAIRDYPIAAGCAVIEYATGCKISI